MIKALTIAPSDSLKEGCEMTPDVVYRRHPRDPNRLEICVNQQINEITFCKLRLEIDTVTEELFHVAGGTFCTVCSHALMVDRSPEPHDCLASE